MRKYSLFLLDADDTIFDFSACCKNALAHAAEESGLAFDDGMHALYLSINDRLWAQLERREITHGELLTLRFALFLRGLGLPEGGAAELNRRYVEALSRECVTFPGARDFLAELCELGDIYVVTNGTASVQHGRMERFGMKEYVKGVFISEEIGAYKPAAGYFAGVRAGIPDFSPGKTLLIGDSLSSDIAMAAAAGVDSVWFNRKEKAFSGAAEPTYVAQGYKDVLKIAAKGAD